MKLIIGNKLINEDIEVILKQLRIDCHGKYLNVIGHENNDNVKITCPHHKGGQETHPSCFVYTRQDNSELEYGYYRCFTCGEKGHLYDLVAHCLDVDQEHGKRWLIDNFCNTFVTEELVLPKIELKREERKYLNEDVLIPFAYYHPYLEDRKVSFEVAKKFNVGWNQEHNSITFPVWDVHGRLVGITERYINEKRFYIPEDLKKPIYLLNFFIEEGITTAFVVESQIDALTLWTWGYPSIAMFGTGSKGQYEILKRSGIRKYYLCFDGDDAGRKGANRFIKGMSKDVIITNINMPDGKDINDLSKEEFEYLLSIS